MGDPQGETWGHERRDMVCDYIYEWRGDKIWKAGERDEKGNRVPVPEDIQKIIRENIQTAIYNWEMRNSNDKAIPCRVTVSGRRDG